MTSEQKAAYRPSVVKVHWAVTRNLIWGPRCQPGAEWSVPLASDARQVTCDECLRARGSRSHARAEEGVCDYCGSHFTDTKTWCEHCDPEDSWTPENADRPCRVCAGSGWVGSRKDHRHPSCGCSCRLCANADQEPTDG